MNITTLQTDDNISKYNIRLKSNIFFQSFKSVIKSPSFSEKKTFIDLFSSENKYNYQKFNILCNFDRHAYFPHVKNWGDLLYLISVKTSNIVKDS
jgi:hypothetical protein